MLYIATGFNELKTEEVVNIIGFCFIGKNDRQYYKYIDNILTNCFIDDGYLILRYPNGKEYKRKCNTINFLLK